MEKDFMLKIINQNKNQLQEVSDCNEQTRKFGLSLSQEDAFLLMEERKQCLVKEERIEFGTSILPKLIFAFCDSAFIYQDNYVNTIGRLVEIFYHVRNESFDEVNDDEIITYMRDKFENECQGSLDYLEETYLEKYTRDVRNGEEHLSYRRWDDMEDEDE